MGVATSVVKGNPDCGGNAPSSPPLEGCRDTGPHENAIFVGGWGGVVREYGIRYLVPFVIPAPRVPANTNVFVGWIRREFYILSAIIFVIPACAGMTKEVQVDALFLLLVTRVTCRPTQDQK